MQRIRSYALVAVPLLFASAACTALLGDFDVTSGAAANDGGDSGDAGNGGDGKVDVDGGGEAGSLAFLTDAVEVAAGSAHTCAIRASGAVVCWGKNDHGQLGVAPTAVSSSSTALIVAGLDPAAHIAAGANHTCIVTKTNRAFCWGDDTEGESGLTPLGAASTGVHEVLGSDDAGIDGGLVAIAAGGRATCALTPEVSASEAPGGGYLYCWGTNDSNQLGVAQTPFKSSVPVQVFLGGPNFPALGRQLAIGLNFGCASLYVPFGASLGIAAGCWGANDRSQLGVDAGASQVAAAIPRYQGGAIANVDLVGTGAKHACVRAASTILLCWGDDTSGQIGALDGGATFTRDAVELVGPNASNVTAIAAGGNETCVIESQIVKCFGANDFGQQGAGAPDKTPHPALTTPTLDPRATALSVGDAHVCAVLGKPGTVMCWGSNASGQLGDALDLSVGYTDSPSNPDLKFARGNPVKVVAPH